VAQQKVCIVENCKTFETSFQKQRSLLETLNPSGFAFLLKKYKNAKPYSKSSCQPIATKVSTPNCNVSRSAKPILRPNWDTTCLQFQHKWSKVTNGSWGIFWGSQWELKHVVLEDVQIRTKLVSHLSQPIPWTSTIHHLLWVTLKIMKPLSITSSYIS
jgi:hypothetical protein